MTTQQLEIYNKIERERLRQDSLLQRAAIPYTPADRTIGPAGKLPILVGVLGDLAHVISKWEAITTEPALRKELVQLAAVCVAWLESLPEQDTQ